MTVKDQDSTFVGDFLGVAMDILTKSCQIQEAANSEQQRTYFSILPKKVKMVSFNGTHSPCPYTFSLTRFPS